MSVLKILVNTRLAWVLVILAIIYVGLMSAVTIGVFRNSDTVKSNSDTIKALRESQAALWAEHKKVEDEQLAAINEQWRAYQAQVPTAPIPQVETEPGGQKKIVVVPPKASPSPAQIIQKKTVIVKKYAPKPKPTPRPFYRFFKSTR